MVGPAMDCLRNPLGAVRIMFKRFREGGAALGDWSKSDWGVQDLFQKFLFEEAAWMKVPEINSVSLDSIPSNSLVRFRGMIQDMFNTEYYIGAYQVGSAWHTAKFTDVAEIHPEAETQVWDRRLVYVVPVPGENTWVNEALASSDLIETSTDEGSKGQKRAGDSTSAEDGFVGMELDSISDTMAKNKRMREDTWSACTGVQETKNHSVDVNIRPGNSKLHSCLVKLYDGANADLKLNDVVEFVGVLTFDPLLSASSFICKGGPGENTGIPFSEDDLSLQLPPSQVPRLQCIIARKLSSHDFLSALPEVATVPPETMGVLRHSLLQGLTQVFGGDCLVAEYFLLHLLSRVHNRRGLLALGKLSLNITGCSEETEGTLISAAAVARAVAVLIPQSRMISLTLETLNDSLFSPRKDYERNRLITGPLQLADGTHLTLDETALRAGQLTDVGMQNMNSLKLLMEWQKVEYDFTYHKMEMPADVPVLVISQGKARLLPADAVVPLRSTARCADMITANDEYLSKWRLYLNYARNLTHCIGTCMHEVIEGDLFSARQENRSLGLDDFHRWLTMARLMSLSYGETTLSAERWRMVKDLERRVAERVRCC